MCTEEQHSATLAALANIQKCLTRRDPLFKTVPVSDALSFVVDYQDREYLFVWSATALTLSNGSSGTFSVPAETWYPLQFRPGDQITTSGNGLTPVFLTLMATDELQQITQIAPGSGWSTSGLAKESGGNLASIQTQISKLLFDGNQYLKTTLLNGANAANIASNGALYMTQATNNASVATGAGNTVVKASAGGLATLVVTTAGTGTGNVLLYDNATTNAGTVLFAFPATVSVAQAYQIYGWAKNGIVAQNVLNGPVFTVYFN